MRFAVADDHPLYREAVLARLRTHYPGAEVLEAASLGELLALAPGPDQPVAAVLLDFHMPGVENGSAVAQVCEAFPGAAVILVSGNAEPAQVTLAMRAGARGYLPKTMATDLFAAAFAMILGGGTYLPAEILDEPVARAAAVPATARALLERLTAREQDVLRLLPSGAPNKEIARQLGLAEITVKLHVRQLLRKIGVRNRAAAAAIAIRTGIVQ